MLFLCINQLGVAPVLLVDPVADRVVVVVRHSDLLTRATAHDLHIEYDDYTTGTKPC